MSIIVTSKNFKVCDKELAFKDLDEVHRIRGRILHFASLVENTLKTVITRRAYDKHKQILKNKKGNIKKFKDLDFNDRSKLFIKYLDGLNKYKNNQEFNKFKSDLNILRKDYRNLWAHGFVYYQKFELDSKDSIYKPVNFIKNNKKVIPIHFKSQYFNIANKIFPNVINFLYKNKFLRLKRFKISVR